MKEKINIVFYFLVIIYLLISSSYFLFRLPTGDELLFISNLNEIKELGIITAIKNRICIPYMLISYPLSFVIKDYLALRFTNVFLTMGFIAYVNFRLKFRETIFYLLFFISSTSYFYFGTNDALFSTSLAVFFIEVFLFLNDEIKELKLAFLALLVTFFTRELILVFVPVIFLSLVLLIKKGFKIKDFKLSLIFTIFMFLLNLPSIINNHKLSYDNKDVKEYKVNWVQRQYLAQLMVNQGLIPNQSHPTWEQTEEYVDKNGENSLPKTTLESIFFDFRLTLKEFIKDFLEVLFMSFRQIGPVLLVTFFSIWIYFKEGRKEKNFPYPSVSLILMMLIFSFIIISFVEIRWLSSVYLLSIVYFSYMQKKKYLSQRMFRYSYLVFLVLCVYGIYKLVLRF
ncbi:hypothetical protein [Flavobacterium oreochromis]|uniref:Glycosyltransferase RgtA/B/C/D-like domain-containing protein n=1 Tax=Flavobacterium columnare TaxID=996 RepID=A0A246GFQ4_9FLAO|nr:hypothetical protein [Flavobacterium oreochromis]OWP79626.1 hypothetical protein BWK62_01505 [Flavobacterium oreochromis]